MSLRKIGRTTPIVFLHGWLGDPTDWHPIARQEDLCPHLPHITLPDKCHLVGYSMGGRIALRLQKLFPEKVVKTVIISAHPGLPQEEREARWKLDCMRAEQLQKIGLQQFLENWYNLPLFATLKERDHFPEVMQRRLQQNGPAMAQLLLSESLANQPSYWDSLDGVHFLFGARDKKYLPLYQRLKTQASLIPDSGHALHLEEPELCRQKLESLLS